MVFHLMQLLLYNIPWDAVKEVDPTSDEILPNILERLVVR